MLSSPRSIALPSHNKMKEKPSVLWGRAEYGEKKQHPAHHPQLLVPNSVTLGTHLYAPFALKKGTSIPCGNGFHWQMWYEIGRGPSQNRRKEVKNNFTGNTPLFAFSNKTEYNWVSIQLAASPKHPSGHWLCAHRETGKTLRVSIWFLFFKPILYFHNVISKEGTTKAFHF